MSAFEWRPLREVDTDHLVATRCQLHQAIQNVAAVGRKFLPESDQDVNATLAWVPGLSRMAGQWVEGDISFRSSIEPAAYKIYLVDRKVQVISSFDLSGKSHRQLMLWLEEQIGKLGLKASNLTMNLPYSLPNDVKEAGDPFELDYPDIADELAKYFHNTYVSLRQVKETKKIEEAINIWPHHFDMALDMILKDTGDPETNTKIAFGMSPGDQYFDRPYFYINTWPFVDTSECPKLGNQAMWMTDDWTGAVLHSKHLFGQKNQQEILDQFYEEASGILINLLTK